MVVKKYYLYVVLVRNNIRCLNNIQEMELHTKKCHKWIDVDFRKIQKHISSNLDYGWRRKTWYKIWLQMKREKQIVLHSNRPGPAPSLTTMVSLPGSPLSVEQATVIFFLYRLLTLTRGPDTIFSELKLASLKYYTP
jgi:hypothetical protein